MADWIKTVDPGGSGNYPSLGAAEVAATGSDDVYLTCFSSDGSDDTDLVNFTGTGTSVSISGGTDYDASGDFPADGIWDDSKYVFYNNNDNLYQFYINQANVSAKNLQMVVNDGGGSSTRILIYINNQNNILLDGLLMKGTHSGTGVSYAVGGYCSDNNSVIQNCVIYDFISGGDSGYRGISLNGNTTKNIYQTTINNCYHGIVKEAGTINAVNCAVFGNTDDFFNVTADYCASDDGDGTNSISPSGGDWANEYPNYASEDFTITNGGNCYQAGAAPTPSVDIIGTSWNNPASIGAFEYATAGAIEINANDLSSDSSIGAAILNAIRLLSASDVVSESTIDAADLTAIRALLAADISCLSQVTSSNFSGIQAFYNFLAVPLIFNHTARTKTFNFNAENKSFNFTAKIGAN